jgi:predicted nucleotidyltransferase
MADRKSVENIPGFSPFSIVDFEQMKRFFRICRGRGWMWRLVESMPIEEVEILIERIIRWAAEEESIQAIALVGSWARGVARDDSDVDLVILTEAPEVYLINDQWMSKFGEVEKITDEDWGLFDPRGFSTRVVSRWSLGLRQGNGLRRGL